MTDHVVKRKPADDPAFRLPSPLAGLAIPLCIGGLITLVVGVLLGVFLVDADFGMSAYLAAFMYALTISIGSLFFVLVQHLCRAGWSVVVRRVAELLMAMILPLAILFIPILVTVWSGGLFPWASPEAYLVEHAVDADVWASKVRYLNPLWFTIRSCVYLAIWCGLAWWFFKKSRQQDETGEVTVTETMQAASGPAIILFSICTTFAAFDWMMSLAPMWFSTMFGVYMFTGGVLAAHCAVAAGSYLLQNAGAMRDEVTIEHYHDLGKLIFGFICFWGYIAFSQYMLIWYGNIPEETVWFYGRQLGPWATVSLILIFFHWLLPLFGTMSRHVRRRPSLVFFWSVYILIMHYLDLYWVIMPENGMGAGGPLGVVVNVVCVLGMIALMLGLVLRVASQSSIIPVRDPRLGESLAFENI